MLENQELVVVRKESWDLETDRPKHKLWLRLDGGGGLLEVYVTKGEYEQIVGGTRYALVKTVRSAGR